MYELDPARFKKAWPLLSRLARGNAHFERDLKRLRTLVEREPPEGATQLFSHYASDDPFWSFGLVMLARASAFDAPKKQTIKDPAKLPKLGGVSFHHGDLRVDGDLSIHDGLAVTGNLVVSGVLTAYQQSKLLLVGGSVQAKGFTSNCPVFIGDSLLVQEAIYVAQDEVTVGRELKAKLVVENSICIGLHTPSRRGIQHDFTQDAMRRYPAPNHGALQSLLREELFTQEDPGAFFGPLFDRLSSGKPIWRSRPRAKPATPPLPKELVAALRRPAKVRRLELTGLKLTSLPRELGALTKLKELRLGGNLLRRLPAEVGQLAALEELWIEDNRLECLPDEIGALRKVTDLIAPKNRLTDLPTAFSGMSALVNLNLEGNPLTQVPKVLYACEGLTRVALRDTQIRQLDADIAKLKKLNGLSLGGRLESLPKEFGKLTQLENLYIYGGALRALPASFAELKQLRNLSVIGQELSEFPEVILGLSGLETLLLSGNKLRSVPDELFSLPALKSVHLNGNPIPKRQQVALAERARAKGRYVEFSPA